MVERESSGTPWELPAGFTIEPDLRSRLFDPSDPDYPDLPAPGPSLYGYELPELASEAGAEGTGSPALSRGSESGSPGGEELRGLPIQPIPHTYWDSMPARCRARMLEFESVRREYERQYAEEPGPELLDSARRLTLEDIVEVALLNSREYQSRKESVYRAALDVTLERFDYATKFAFGGNGASADYTFSRDDGSTTESLGIFSSLQIDKLLAFGGNLFARVANNVVFTFEGPAGWSRDISSEIAVGFTQSLLQREIVLNPLIQSERNLIYATREFARFRKVFYFQLAARYYGLLRSYRSIEIESQNYFSLVRAFEQAQAEVRAGVESAPNPVAVDQFEQSMLSGRSSLIAASNGLERDLDGLKLALGVPTETPVNVDLGELEELTLRDGTEVAAERVRRWQNRLRDRRDQRRVDRGEILNANIFLVERLLDWLDQVRQLGQETPQASSLRDLLGGLKVSQARVDFGRSLAELRRAEDSRVRPPASLVYQRVTDLIRALLRLSERQLELAESLRRGAAATAEGRTRLQTHAGELESLTAEVARILDDPRQERLQELLERAARLRTDLEEAVASQDELIVGAAGLGETLEATLERSDGLLEESGRLLRDVGLGLPAVDMAADDAMATALIQRLDLMNERGRLADDWRAVKLAADDLKSVLNLNASYTIGTEDDKPFKFTAEESRAQVGLSFDLPLNRRAQRNRYRQALIDYQAQRRQLMELEDSIKLDVRDDLRNLAETRIQYAIGVRRAALAAEQVLSVRLQLALGVQGVRGTDLLLALQASREALTAVANSRIGYITIRAGFALDLEILELDELGRWPQIDDADYQPEPDLVYPENAGPTYGPLPSWLWLSGDLEAQLDQPLPGSPARQSGDAATGERPTPTTSS